MKEFWKDIKLKGVKPIYEVSSFGRIRNKETGKLRSLNKLDKDGYVIITLAAIGKGKRTFRVARIVCKHFKPAKYVGQNTVNHKDGNHTNDNIYNLEWMTVGENVRHAFNTGLQKSCEESHSAIFNNKEVHKICKLFEKGYGVKDVIIELYSESDDPKLNNRLSKIKHRKNWKRISKDYKW